MNVNLDLYRIFYIVAKNGSISSAANILYISQPAITIQIKNSITAKNPPAVPATAPDTVRNRIAAPVGIGVPAGTCLP